MENSNEQTFYFNTGVKLGVNPYLDETATATEAVGGGYVMCIPFTCKDVPTGASFAFISDHVDQPAAKGMIIREIYNTKMIGKYAFFYPPVNTAAAAE